MRKIQNGDIAVLRPGENILIAEGGVAGFFCGSCGGIKVSYIYDNQLTSTQVEKIKAHTNSVPRCLCSHRYNHNNLNSRIETK